MRTVNLCGGPAGWQTGVRDVLGQDVLERLDIESVEINADAAATANKAGFRTCVADAWDLDPDEYEAATGLIGSPPCGPWSGGGTGAGLRDEQVVLDAVSALGSGPGGDDAEELIEGCGIDCPDGCWDIRGRVEDPRTALVPLVLRWALKLPNLEWMVLEQVPALERCWEEFCAELSWVGWESFDTMTFDAVTFGASARRKRTYVRASRRVLGGYSPSGRVEYAKGPTMAEALGWGPGEWIRTRGQRKATGGNLFSADGPSWCLTGKARSWTRESDGRRLTSAEAGYLNGFPWDHPWTGSRSAQFQQAGDVVCPPASAAVVGSALGIDWAPKVEQWAEARRADAAGVLFLDAA